LKIASASLIDGESSGIAGTVVMRLEFPEAGNPVKDDWANVVCPNAASTSAALAIRAVTSPDLEANNFLSPPLGEPDSVLAT
jgi:hypothetical protein